MGRKSAAVAAIPEPEEELNFYGLQRLGFDEIPLPDDRLDAQTEIEKICFRIGHRPEEGGLGKFQHFKNYVDLTWNHPKRTGFKKFLWHEWSEKVLRRFCDESEVGIAGCTSCVAGHTRMLDPFTGEAPTIESLCEQGKRPWVQTVNGPVLAEVPFLKGETELLKFRLSNGSEFVCTAEHRLLSPEGWIFASEVRSGGQLLGYVPSLQGSISGNDLSDPPQDAHRCSGTTGGSQEHCSACCRPGGGQLRLAQELVRDALPSQGDARKCSSCVSEPGDDLSHGSGHTRPCRSADLSTHNASLQSWWSGIRESLRSFVGSLGRSPLWFQSPGQSRRENTLPRTSGAFGHPLFGSLNSAIGFYPPEALECPVYSGSTQPSSPKSQSYPTRPECSQVPETSEPPCHCAQASFPASHVFSSSGLMVERVQVTSISKSGKGKFYDLHVPGEEHYFAEGAIHHNSGKSSPAALWAVANYQMDPTHTKVLILSTTIKGAKDRVWKDMTEFWDSSPHKFGKFLKSTNEVQGLNFDEVTYGYTSGIFLHAAEKSSEASALNALIGTKAPKSGMPGATFEELIENPEFIYLKNEFPDEDYLRDLIDRLQAFVEDRVGKLIVVIDEATGVAEAVLNAIMSNLKPGNAGRIQIIVLGNPASPWDAHGIFCEPDVGWQNVSIMDDEWRTKTGGVCIRFDGLKNPRIVSGNERLTWMLRKADIQAMAKKYGENSVYFYRMVRAFWPPMGADSGAYSAADFIQTGAMRNPQKPMTWGYERPILLAGFDPAYTTEGDRALCWVAKLGKDINGKQTLEFVEDFLVVADASDKVTPVPHQMARNWRDECRKRGIRPENACFDATGGGVSFASIVSVEWSPLVHAISSGGKASTRPVGGEKHPDGKPVLAHERFFNKMTEIWLGMLPFLREGQIKGITNELAKEICSRQYDKGTTGDARILRVESKRIYSAREKGSPDLSDAAFLVVEHAVTRHNFKCIETAGGKDPEPEVDGDRPTGSWDALKAKARGIKRSQTPLKR